MHYLKNILFRKKTVSESYMYLASFARSVKYKDFTQISLLTLLISISDKDIA